MRSVFYAHSIEGQPPERWQILEEHLNNVAKLAVEFARSFGGKALAEQAGKNHDEGKATFPWQAYLRHANQIVDELAPYYKGRVEHAAPSAQRIYSRSNEAGKLLAYCIAGHHGGLTNWDDASESALKIRLEKKWDEIKLPLDSTALPKRLPFKTTDRDLFGYQLQFFVRMLFSCLVDADYLDTESALDQTRSSWRSRYPNLKDLYKPFWSQFNLLRNQAEDSLVKRQRESVLADCLKATNEASGLFSLTVPTGGGKTLASLAFALEHAKKHAKPRIFYVIPYTSIVEQNAAVFREMLGEDAVLEHHCNFIPDEADWTTRLACENWDAPLVVTTNVQFFNSFYARKPSKCRKLHNVADSVVIFDEVQAIPVEKLKPCIEVIRELAMNYKVTPVLCTATQPAIHFSDAFHSGLRDVREIVQDVPALYAALKRTRESFLGTLTEDEVAEKLEARQQVLCIVNTRQQALDIFAKLPSSEENMHLSALMYPAHRSRMLAEIRRRLDEKLPCRVVSTQLIEAGVDVDFACVFRAVSGIDSIAQAAGRCNRNGHSQTPGPVFVFNFPEVSDNAYFRKAAQSAQKLFEAYDGDLTSPDCVQAYFLDYFWKNQHQMDEKGTLDLCRLAQEGNIQFKDIAAFQMIETATLPVVVAIEEAALDLVDRLANIDRPGSILRRLQQYTVQIYPYQFDEIHSWLENPHLGVWILRSEEMYSQQTGLRCSPPEGCAFFG